MGPIYQLGMSEEDWLSAREQCWDEAIGVQLKKDYPRAQVKLMREVYFGKAEVQACNGRWHVGNTDVPRETWRYMRQQEPTLWALPEIHKSWGFEEGRVFTPLQAVRFLVPLHPTESYSRRFGWRLESSLELFQFVMGQSFSPRMLVDYRLPGSESPFPWHPNALAAHWLCGWSYWARAMPWSQPCAYVWPMAYLTDYFVSVLPHVSPVLFADQFSARENARARQMEVRSALFWLARWDDRLIEKLTREGLDSTQITRRVELVRPFVTAFEARILQGDVRADFREFYQRGKAQERDEERRPEDIRSTEILPPEEDISEAEDALFSGSIM